MFEEGRRCWKREHSDGRGGQNWKREDRVETGWQCSKEDSGARRKLTKRNIASKVHRRNQGNRRGECN